MKQAIIIGTFSLMAILLTACSGSSTKEQNKDTAMAAPSADTTGKMMASVKYTCTMHPEVISDTPGKCPKCGMDLVKKEASADSSMKMDSMKH